MPPADHAPPVDALPDGLLVHDPATGEILRTNGTCREILGYAGSELRGRSVSALGAGGGYAPGTDGRRVRQARAGGPVRFDWTVEAADGTAVPVTVSLAVTDRDGTELAVATLREAAGGESREGDAAGGGDTAGDDPDGAVDADGGPDRDAGADGARTDDGRAGGDSSADDARPGPGDDPTGRDDRGGTPWSPRRRLFEDGRLFVWEMDLSEGRRRAEAVVAEAGGDGTDGDGADDGFDLAAHLEANPETAAHLLDGAEVLDVNDRAVEYYRAGSRRELVENVDRVMTEESMATFRDLWATVVDGGTEFRTDCTAETFDGERRDMLLELVVPPEGVGDYSRVYMAGVDVTDRARRERELERKNEFLDEFAAVVSHDVDTPLGVIENRARLVEVTGDPDHAADIYEAAERVRSLVDDLRALARRGRRVDETRPVDVARVARDAWAAVETDPATLAVADPGTVEADPDRLRQLFENLFENSVEHGSTGPRPGTGDSVEHGSTGPRSHAPGNSVEHGSTGPRSPTGEGVEPGAADRESGGPDPRRSGDPLADGGGPGTAGTPAAADGRPGDDGDGVAVRVGGFPGGFYVADDGPGVPDRHRDAVFERGFSTGDGTGSGLGLAIVARIAEGHGWSVGVADAEGGGARFEVYTRVTAGD